MSELPPTGLADTDELTIAGEQLAAVREADVDVVGSLIRRVARIAAAHKMVDARDDIEKPEQLHRWIDEATRLVVT